MAAGTGPEPRSEMNVWPQRKQVGAGTEGIFLIIADSQRNPELTEAGRSSSVHLSH